VKGRRGSRRRKLLDDLKERRGYSRLKEKALDRTIWRTRFGRGFGPVMKQTTKWRNKTIVVVYCTCIICILEHHEKFPVSVAAYIGEQSRTHKHKIHSVLPSVPPYVTLYFSCKIMIFERTNTKVIHLRRKTPWKYRVIHKSLRNFRTRLRKNQERHGRKEHINK